MPFSFLRAAAAIGSLIVAVACSSSSNSSAPPSIQLATANGTGVVEVTGLSSSTLRALGSPELTPDQWPRILRVAVDDAALPMLGHYGVNGGVLRFTPAFPLDPGRSYRVRFDPAAVPGAEGAAAPLVATITRPAEHTVPSTVVTRVYPSGDVVPANLLRLYIEFSGPMGRPSGVPFLKLLDDRGEEIPGAFLPLDYEFWSPDHRRFTAFLDPGRVKEGILPNQQMGRPLKSGQTVTLVVSREWRDEHGLPLKEEYRRVFQVGAADRLPLDPATWRLQPPAAGSRDAVVVTFPKPLDRGLLTRALGVTHDGKTLDGDIVVDTAETRWLFTPREPWRRGGYQLLALDILEDVTGNQIGRAFEVDNFDTVDKSPNPKSITIPFQIP